MLHYYNEKPVFAANIITRKIENCPENIIVVWNSKLFYTFESMYKTKHLVTFNCGVKCNVIRTDNLAIVNIPSGSPVVAMFIEEAFVWGFRNFIFIGSCGILDGIKDSCMILPVSALSDEGTSVHYGGTDIINIETYSNVKNVIENIGIPYRCGSVWTTDAPFRECKSAINEALEKGCICVDMETSTAACVCRYVGARSYHLFYTSDIVSNDKWEKVLSSCCKEDVWNVYIRAAVSVALGV